MTCIPKIISSIAFHFYKIIITDIPTAIKICSIPTLSRLISPKSSWI